MDLAAFAAKRRTHDIIELDDEAGSGLSQA